MNPANIEDIIVNVISGLNWNFIISCYGEDPDKLKFVIEKIVERKGKKIITHQYINPTIEILQNELRDIIKLVVIKNYQIFYYGHWTVRQVSGADVKDDFGDSIEVMFTPCRFTVIEERKISKQTRKVKNTTQHFRSAFKNRLEKKDEFEDLLKVEKNTTMLEEMLKVCLDPKTEDYETAGKIHSRIEELKKKLI